MNVKEMQRRILKLIKMHGITLGDLSRKVDLSVGTLQHYSSELCVLKHPSADIIVALADFFQVPTDYILGRCELGENYEANIKELYEKSYETYLKRKKPNATTEDLVTCSESPLYDAGYPYNLIDCINRGLGEPIDVPFSDEQIACLEKVIDTELKEREAACIRLYFDNGLTLKAIGEEFNVTAERIRQLLAKALRKLRSPARVKLIKYGYEAAIELNKDILEANRIKAKLVLELKKTCNDIEYLEKVLCEVETDGLEKPVSVLEMGLSVRAVNAIVRYFIVGKDSVKKINSWVQADAINIFDVKRLALEEKLLDIRNLGKRTTIEIIHKLNEFGALSGEEIVKLSEMYPDAFNQQS